MGADVTRFYAKISITGVSLWLMLVIAARIIGNMQPPNPIMNGFAAGCENQPPPCWYGIVPGTTSVESGNKIVSTLHLSCEIALIYDGYTQVILSLTLRKCQNLHFGDLIVTFDNGWPVGTTGDMIFMDSQDPYFWTLSGLNIKMP
jgi:hypothetical protein